MTSEDATKKSSALLGAYRGLYVALRTYWIDYGGLAGLVLSPLFHLSVLITACSYTVWLDSHWTDIPLSVLPNLLGFSLGAYALIFSLAGEGLMLALALPSTPGARPLLNMINATFLHFITIQTVAIVFALAQKGSAVLDLVDRLPVRYGLKRNLEAVLAGTAGAFGYWLTVYAVVLLIGAGLAVYRLANMSGSAARAAHAARQEPASPASPQRGGDTPGIPKAG